ncbi:MAG: chromate efflux transporter [Deltaproteobacteria bacterium]|nr:chromate efflux transporter [Deltaproteobacteria bacterium]MDZ4224769.1 chromate efflux transporter [bacterium]
MQPFTLSHLLLYFLRLGATGFGGPVALIGYMHKDLVEEKKWFTNEEYLHGVALAQIVPGPLAMQLAIYFGYLKAKIRGATLVAFAFILPSFFIVWAMAWAYVEYSGLPWIHSVFYGMSAAVIAVIVQAAWRLIRITLHKKWGLWFIFLLLAVTTAWIQKASFLLFMFGGLLGIILYAFPKNQKLHSLIPLQLFAYFFKAAIVVYGSGMAIIPFIYGDMVNRLQWLNNQQFMDAVAVGMITPGPALITVGFIGYLVDDLAGAVVSVAGIFCPVYLFVIICAPWFFKIVKNPKVKAFVDGVTAAAAGAIAGSVWILGKQAITDWPTILIAIGTLIFLLKTKIPVPLLLLTGGLVGWAVKTV